MNSTKQSELIILLKTYIKNWKLFLFSFIFCVGLAGGYILLKNPVFKIDANILIKEDSKSGGLASNMLKSIPVSDMLGVGGGAVDDEVEIISSYSNIFETVKSLNLNVKYIEGFLKKKEFYLDSPIKVYSIEPNMADTFRFRVEMKVLVDKDENVKVKAYYDGDKIADVKSKFPVKVNTLFGDFIVDKTNFFEPDEKLRMRVYFDGCRGTALTIKRNLGISIVSKKSNVINLTNEDELPNRSVDLLNVLIEKYNDYGLNEKNAEAIRTDEFLSKRLLLLESQLKTAESNVEIYKEKNELTDLGVEAELLVKKSSDFRENIIRVETQYSIISMLEDFVKNPENRYSVVPTSFGINLETASGVISSYNSMLLYRNKLLRSSSLENPILESLNEQIDTIRYSVIMNIESIKHGIQCTLDDLKAQEAKFINRIKGVPKREREYIELRRLLEIKQTLYVYLLQQQEENAMKLAAYNPKAQIVDKAFIYNKPVKPMKKLIALAALLFSILLPMGYIYIRNMIRSKFDDKASLDDLNIVVSDEIHASKDSVLFSGKNSISEENIRGLRSSVIRKLGKDSVSNTILVASICKGEGKSFIALNLALSFAKMGKKTIIVDSDLRTDEYPIYLNSEVVSFSEYGLVDIIKDNVAAASVIKRTNIDENLYILPSGKSSNIASELLLNKKLSVLLDELKKSFDYIIFDSVRLLDYPDTVALFDISDCTIFVTRANYSDKQTLGYIETLIENNKLSKYICVVNDVKSE